MLRCEVIFERELIMFVMVYVLWDDFGIFIEVIIKILIFFLLWRFNEVNVYDKKLMYMMWFWNVIFYLIDYEFKFFYYSFIS